MTDADIDEVWADCPQCGEEIPFYRTVDTDKRCPECGTDADTLFEIGIASQPIAPAAEPETELALTDGGPNE